jgi:hypothetical protein
VVDVLSDCGFSGAVEFASLRICGFVMLRMSALAPAGLCCLSSLTCTLGARRQVPHDGLVEANSAYRCNKAHCPPSKPFGCGGGRRGLMSPHRHNLSLRSLVTGETGFACVACFCLCCICYLSLIVLPFFRPQPSVSLHPSEHKHFDASPRCPHCHSQLLTPTPNLQLDLCAVASSEVAAFVLDYSTADTYYVVLTHPAFGDHWLSQSTITTSPRP